MYSLRTDERSLTEDGHTYGGQVIPYPGEVTTGAVGKSLHGGFNEPSAA